MKNLHELVRESATESAKREEELHGNNKYYSLHPIEWHAEEILKETQRDVPALYKDAWLTDDKLFEKIRKNFNEGRGCYFYGGIGTGKTYLLYAILRLLRARSSRARVINVPDFLSHLKTFYGKGEDGERAVRDELDIQAYLFIDDFGAENVTEWNTDIMYQLINMRYENKLRTFFASNLSLQQLAERSGDRIVSRIAEMCEVSKIDGPDRRLPKNEV